jgi:hypothetical protein
VDGGWEFKFASKTVDPVAREKSAKDSMRAVLNKQTAVSHQLPNGRFGLLVWYPGVKPEPRPRKNKTLAIEAAASVAPVKIGNGNDPDPVA